MQYNTRKGISIMLKKLKITLTSIALSVLWGFNAFATEVGNPAIDDILKDPRYEGAMDSIAGFTKIVDRGFIIFVTFVAFLIISTAILRNVLAGAYYAFPKFWDKVDQAHKDNEAVKGKGWIQRSQDFFQGGGYQSYGTGSLMQSILGMLPNIKVFTDFEGDNVDFKQYFIRAVPQMVCIVLIGVFIYNGYYRDTTILAANFGSTMIVRFMNSADPVAAWDHITGMSGTPEFATDSAQDDRSKMVNETAHEIYKKVIGTYSDITDKVAKAQLAGNIETWSSTQVDALCGAYMEGGLWSYKVSTNWTTGSTSMQSSVSKDNSTAIIVFPSLHMGSLNFDSAKAAGEDNYMSVFLTFTRKNAGSQSVTVNDFAVTMPADGWTGGAMTFIGAKGYFYPQNGSCTIGGEKVAISSTNGGVTLTFSSGAAPSGSNLPVVGLSYYAGAKHGISTISMSNSVTTPELVSPSKNLKITYGEEVKITNTGTPAPTSAGDNSNDNETDAPEPSN